MCGADKPRDAAHRSLAVNTASGAWTCHRCHERGLLKDKWTDRVPQPRQARTRAAVARAFALPQPAPKKADDAAEGKWRVWWNNSSPLINSGKTGFLTYIEGRGIPAELADAAGVRASHDFYGQAAVLFPVTNQTGALVAVSSRYITADANLKTQTAGRKSDGVFATPGALESAIVAVCEAPIDALSLWLCGIPAIALIGCSAPAWLPTSLAWRDVLLATDADKGGDGAAARLTAEIEARGGRTFRLRARGAKDWNEALQQRGQDALRASLAPFTPTCTDELRAMHALDLRRVGRMDAARFVAGLIGKAILRECVRARLRSSEPDAVGELLDDIHIPAEIMNDESLAARCLDAHRLPASFVVTSAA
jgi:hypothetical protein